MCTNANKPPCVCDFTLPKTISPRLSIIAPFEKARPTDDDDDGRARVPARASSQNLGAKCVTKKADYVRTYTSGPVARDEPRGTGRRG